MKSKKYPLNVFVITLIVLTLSMAIISASTVIPKDMTTKEFKKEVSKANSLGGFFSFLSTSSTGGWMSCGSYYFPYSTSSCNPCPSDHIASNCFYACHNPAQCLSCCSSVSSCSSPFCCGSQNGEKQCYCDLPSVECSGGADPGDKKCQGDNVYKCSSSGSWEQYRSCDYECENARCVSDPCDGVNCEDKCEGDIKLYGGYCSDGNCEYEETFCEGGCSNGMCEQDACDGVNCEDKCEDSLWYHEGTCVDGECIYGSQDTCQFGCQNEPTLSILTSGGMCREGGCEFVCEDYCSGTTLYYNGECIGNECTQYQEKEYAEECAGGSEWYANMWIWIGIISFIIFSIFGMKYLRK